jgi:hypothetical protein
METIELCGREFRKTSSTYLEFCTSPHPESHELFFNEKMGFDCRDARNYYIQMVLGFKCKGCSPQFRTNDELVTFIKWFRNKYGRERIILTKNQIKNLLWKL